MPVSSFLIHFFCNDYDIQFLLTFRDINTLFRSSSMASKVLYELMKFVGHQYLVISLKPVIDKVSFVIFNLNFLIFHLQIYSEKKNCEIDPSKLQHGDNIEQNTVCQSIFTFRFNIFFFLTAKSNCLRRNRNLTCRRFESSLSATVTRYIQRFTRRRQQSSSGTDRSAAVGAE